MNVYGSNSKMLYYSQLEPWFIADGMASNMAQHGVTVPMWFCPAWPNRYKTAKENFCSLRGRELSMAEDLIDFSVNFR